MSHTIAIDGKKLKAFREGIGLSKAQLAEAIRCDKMRIHQVEEAMRLIGRHACIRRDLLENLARLAGLHVEAAVKEFAPVIDPTI